MIDQNGHTGTKKRKEEVRPFHFHRWNRYCCNGKIRYHVSVTGNICIYIYIFEYDMLTKGYCSSSFVLHGYHFSDSFDRAENEWKTLTHTHTCTLSWVILCILKIVGHALQQKKWVCSLILSLSVHFNGSHLDIVNVICDLLWTNWMHILVCCILCVRTY